MKKNIGTVDRTLRVVAGLSIIGLGIFYGNWLGVVGVIPLVTATLGWCPAYVPFGFSSCKAS